MESGSGGTSLGARLGLLPSLIDEFGMVLDQQGSSAHGTPDRESQGAIGQWCAVIYYCAHALPSLPPVCRQRTPLLVFVWMR